MTLSTEELIIKKSSNGRILAILGKIDGAKCVEKQWHLLFSGALLKTRHVFIIVKRIIYLIIHVDRSNGEAHFMQYLLHMSTLIAPIE